MTPGRYIYQSNIPNQLRLLVYRWFVEHSRPPTVDEAAEALGVDTDVVGQALTTLNDEHILVLEPDATTIRMAMPWSAVPTDFRVTAGGREYWANCAWDAMGVLAALAADGTIASRCGDCREPITLVVRDGRLHAAQAVVNFAVPAARWWDDITET